MAEKKIDGTSPAIFKAISGVMAEVGAVKKDKVNQQQKFKFRGIDDVMNALHPAMIKNKIFVVPEVLEQVREERQTKSGGNLLFSICKIRYTFFATDGSSVEAVVIGEGMDSGDKATNKAMAVAFKYACFQVFCIPTEEMKDPDAEIAPPSTPKGAEEPQSEPVAKESSELKEIHSKTIKAELERTGISEETFFKALKIPGIDEMNMKHFEVAMKKFEKTPDKEPPEEIDDPRLPWN
jgi:hypothetical protein